MVPCQRCFIYGTRRSKEMGRGGGFKVTIGGGGGGGGATKGRTLF